MTKLKKAKNSMFSKKNILFPVQEETYFVKKEKNLWFQKKLHFLKIKKSKKRLFYESLENSPLFRFPIAFNLNYSWSDKEKISEKQSRNWRFQCFSRLYITNKYSSLLTGHTATDRAETALLQLIRGTSFYGITSFKSAKKYSSLYPKYYNYSIFLQKT